MAAAMAAFHLYSGAFGALEAFLQRAVHLSFALAIILLLAPAFTSSRYARVSLVWDAVLGTAAVASMGYLFFNYDYLLSERFQFVTPVTGLQTALGLGFLIVVLETTRRLTGWALPALALISIAFAFISGLPGILSHRGYSLGNVIDAQYLTTVGVFGIPLGASANYIAVFIIFGAFLAKSGLGQLIVDLAMAVGGRYRGGPAKVSVIASAAHGTISGSAPANVSAVGVLTIPLMKRVGYSPTYAGAIEAAASTGGILMPPVMGSIAFIMAQYTGIPYSLIALYAIIPAVLYFAGVMFTAHWAACREGMVGLSGAEMPDIWRALRQRGQLLLPVALLIYFLVEGYTPQYAVVYSVIAVIAVAALRRETRMGPRDILDALANGGRGAVLVAVATATAGIIVGILELTGVAVLFSQSFAGWIGGNLLAGLVIVAFVTIVLGTGIPPSASYIVQVAVTIPVVLGLLEARGFDGDTATLLTHFFVMYFATSAVITPPDALASIAAAGIAESGVIRTALLAMRVAFAAYVVPFLFIYRPELLLQGDPLAVAAAFVLALLGIMLFSAGFEGYFLTRLSILERVIIFASAAAFVVPSNYGVIAGFSILAVLIIVQLVRRRSARGTGPQSATQSAAEKEKAGS